MASVRFGYNGIEAGIANVCGWSVAANLIEERHRIALGVPIAEATARNVAQIEWHPLLIDGAARLDADDGHQFVDNERVRVSRERFAVAFRKLVFSETGLLQLHHDAIRDLIARTLGKLRFQVDDRIFIRTDHCADRRKFQRFGVDGLGPRLNC